MSLQLVTNCANVVIILRWQQWIRRRPDIRERAERTRLACAVGSPAGGFGCTREMVNFVDCGAPPN